MTTQPDGPVFDAGRALGLATATVGAVSVVFAGPTARVAGKPGSPPDVRIVRVLGARQVVQGLVTAAVPTSDVLLLGAGVDAAHAASMVPLLLSRRFRRPAMLSAALAAGSALLAARLARRP